MKVYVESNSKEELKRKFNNGEKIIGTEYNLFNPNGYETTHVINDLKIDTVIAIYKEKVENSPYAHSWGTYIANDKIIK
jgi:hypothetical protein